jgi:hypothetical protein
MTETRPIGEQLRFNSSKTGSHNLDAYLEAAERGTRTLADLLSDMWSPTTGQFRTDLYQFRFNSTAGLLQFRVGDYVDPNAGWINITGTETLGDLAAITTQANLAIAAKADAETAASTALTNSNTALTNANTATTQAGLANTARLAAEAALDSFDDRYLGPKSSDPTTDNDGNVLLAGALYWNTTVNEMRAYTGTAWTVTYNPSSGAVSSFNSRTGAVLPAADDYTIAQITGLTTALAGKSDTGHNHTASHISDASANGRSLLTAADYAAMRALLGVLTPAGGDLTGPLNWAPMATVASAATTNIGAAASNRVSITGTTTITSFGTTANAVRLIHFAGALTLTHNATTLILPGGANIVTAANDTAFAISDASGNWRVTDYDRATGQPSIPLAFASIATAAVATAAEFQAATASKLLNAANVWSAAALVTIAPAATLTPNLAAGINFIVNGLNTNATLAAPTSPKAGQTFTILIIQDATGGRTLSYNSVYKHAGGTAFAIDTVASRVSLLSCFVRDASNIIVTGVAGAR